MEYRKLVDIVFEAIDEINEMLPNHNKIQKSLKSKLLDGSDKLDSLTFVNFIVAIETRIEEDFNITVSLMEGLENADGNKYFISVGSLVEYIRETLEES